MPSGQSESPTHIGVFRIFVRTVCPRLHGVNLRTYPPFFIFFSKNFREKRERDPHPNIVPTLFQHCSNIVPTLFRPPLAADYFFSHTPPKLAPRVRMVCVSMMMCVGHVETTLKAHHPS